MNEVRTHPHCIDPLVIPAVSQGKYHTDVTHHYTEGGKTKLQFVLTKCKEPWREYDGTYSLHAYVNSNVYIHTYI